MIDTQSYLNEKKAADWSKRVSPPTSLKVDRLVAARSAYTVKPEMIHTPLANFDLKLLYKCK